jgi:hypothetical protein
MNITLNNRNITIDENSYYYPDKLNETIGPFNISAPTLMAGAAYAMEISAICLPWVYNMHQYKLFSLMFSAYLASIPFFIISQIKLNDGSLVYEREYMLDSLHLHYDYITQTASDWFMGEGSKIEL